MNKKRYVALAILLASIFLVNEVSHAWIVAAAGAARRVRKNMQEKDPVKVNNTVCPVLGNKVNMKDPVTVEYKGEIYNLCCPMCIDEFNKDPEKYSQKAKAQAKEQAGK